MQAAIGLLPDYLLSMDAGPVATVHDERLTEARIGKSWQDAK